MRVDLMCQFHFLRKTIANIHMTYMAESAWTLTQRPTIAEEHAVNTISFIMLPKRMRMKVIEN